MGHNSDYFTRMLAGLGEVMGFDIDTPWRKLPAKARKAILEGCDEQVHVRYRNRYGRTRSYADFEGVMAFCSGAWTRPSPSPMKERYEVSWGRAVPGCDGTRLKPEILAVTLSAGSRPSPLPTSASCPIADWPAFLNN